jgi:hypothetical protein
VWKFACKAQYNAVVFKMEPVVPESGQSKEQKRDSWSQQRTKLFHVDIIRKRHAASVDSKDAPLRLGIRKGKFYLAINAARAD